MYPLGISKWKPSAISETPIIIKKQSAKTLNDGCLDINPLIGFEANNIMITVTITAVYITQSSSTIPTAVIIESTEKTKSNRITSPKSLLKFPFFGSSASCELAISVL